MHWKFCACTELLSGISIRQVKPSDISVLVTCSKRTPSSCHSHQPVCLVFHTLMLYVYVTASLHNERAGTQTNRDPNQKLLQETTTKASCPVIQMVWSLRRRSVWPAGSVSPSRFLWRVGEKPTTFKQKNGRSWGWARARIKRTQCLQNALISKTVLAHKKSELYKSEFMKRSYLSGQQKEAEESVFLVGRRHHCV